tara:strand:- start:5008 stop:6585 length:1578 start_codon:yes stop_codon:yes gene_type:complete
MKKKTLYKLIEQVLNEAEIKELMASADPDYIAQAVDIAVMLGDEEKQQVIDGFLQLKAEDFLYSAHTLMEEDDEFSVRQMMPIYDTVKYTLLSVFRKRRMPTITRNQDASPWLLEQAYLFLNRLHQKKAADRDMLYLAKNPATPVKVLNRLKTYWMAEVRKSAENNLSSRDPLEEKKKRKKKEKTKKDACYHKVKSRYDVWPSAYASGALVKCRKVGAKNWGNSKKESLGEAEITDDEKEELKDISKQLKGAVKAHGKQAKTIDKAIKKEGKKNCGCGQDPCKTYGIQEQKTEELEERCQKGYKTHDTQKTKEMFGRTYRNCVKAEEGQLDEEGLKAWFDDADGDGQSGWEQIGGKYDGKPCAKQPGQKTKPKCASPEKAASMTKKERDSAARRKRKKDPNPNRKGKAKNVNTDPKKESLYRIIEAVIEEMNNELAEAELEEKKNSKCTKATKKASSTRKGKKWMKCVKSDSGGYKRIHWGQKGVRVTGKSGNTKRKKSFKARHNCSKAKSNTPQGQACKDWAEE